jgi:hypothetical protein
MTPRETTTPAIGNPVNPLPKIEPLPGSLHFEWRRCGRSNCRCASGRLHGHYPTGLRSFAPLASSCPDEFPLELGQASEHRRHQASMRGGGVRPYR